MIVCTEPGCMKPSETPANGHCAEHGPCSRCQKRPVKVKAFQLCGGCYEASRRERERLEEIARRGPVPCVREALADLSAASLAYANAETEEEFSDARKRLQAAARAYSRAAGERPVKPVDPSLLLPRIRQRSTEVTS